MASPLQNPSFFLFFSILLLLLCMTPPAAAAATAASAQDQQQVLLKLKLYWGSPPSLASWTNSSSSSLPSSSSYCSWSGITCSGDGGITNLTLKNAGLAGPAFPFSLCAKLPNLIILDLRNNSLTGALNASVIDDCSGLVYLDLSSNSLTGTMPPELGNLTRLQTLYLAINPFTNSSVPSFLAKLTSLQNLYLDQCNLYGNIPGDTLAGLKSLSMLSMANNSLYGEIPPAVWDLPNLQYLFLYANSLSGQITINGNTIGAAGLIQIDVSQNNLTGSIPAQFGTLRNLSYLYMSFNQLTGEIPASIGKLPLLTRLRLFNNSLTGVLPSELGKHSPLYDFEVAYNQLTGEIPPDLCANGQLANIIIAGNNISGEIPASLGDCAKMRTVFIQNNRLSGELPAGWLAPTSSISYIFMSDNQFNGTLPAVLPPNLTTLDAGNNQLSGQLPKTAPSLAVFDASGNLLSGPIPTAIASGMPLLQKLDLGGNQLAGEIPQEIGDLRSLNLLDLSDNRLSGGIPASIGGMPVLNSLDLAANGLSGEIPSEIGNLKLDFLNLSGNALSGEIPATLATVAYDNSFLGNPNLCAPKTTSNDVITGIPACSAGASGGGGGGISGGVRVALALAGAMLLAAATALACIVIRDTKKKRKNAQDHATWKMTSFAQLDFTEAAVLRGLTEANTVGCGGAGRVYRVVVGNGGKAVAVKRLKPTSAGAKSEREFESEVKILGSIRHVNIIKLLCCISNAETKLLVYEYMEKGSLDRWLHDTGKPPADWPVRVGIAVDAARGLCYMHHECAPPVVHRDIKSSNILVDAEFRAKVADFGLARGLAGDAAVANTGSMFVAGSVGYMAPETAYSKKVSDKIDVYSFGVVLLELTTGRRADDGDNHSCLADWAWRCLQERRHISEVADERIKDPAHLGTVEVVYKLGIICTGRAPSTRPTMREVLQVLERCQQTVAGVAGNDKGKERQHDSVPLLRAGSRHKALSRSTKENADDRKYSDYYNAV